MKYDLSNLSKTEKMGFLSMQQALAKTNIPVIFADETQKKRALRNLGDVELLWFSGGDKNFSKTVTLAQNTKGIVASDLAQQKFNVLHLERHVFSGDWPQALSSAKQWLNDKANLPEFITVYPGTPAEYKCRLSNLMRVKFLSSSALAKSKEAASLAAHLSVMQRFQEILQNSVDVEIHADYAKDKTGERNVNLLQSVDILIHVLYTAVELEGEVYRVKTILKELRSDLPRPYAFEVESTELQPKQLKLQTSPESNLEETESNIHFVEGIEFLKGIEKSYDLGKTLLDESEKLKGAMSDFFLNGRNMASTTLHNDIYGWVDEGKIFLTKEGLHPKTLVHEYTHLWAKAMQLRNPEGWQSIVNTLKTKSPLWELVQKDPAYVKLLTNDGKIASEVLARLTEFSAYQRVENIANSAINSQSTDDFYEFLDEELKVLKKMWSWTADNVFNNLKFNDIDEIQDRVFFDLYTSEDLGVKFGPEDFECKIVQREKTGNCTPIDAKSPREFFDSISKMTCENAEDCKMVLK